MYEAKASCGSGCAVFEPGMRTRRLEDQGLESELRAAIARDQFEVHYQPIVSLTRGVVSGFEALVRWRHPRLGLIPPHRFIPVAEQTGLIATISWRVLELACRQLSAWHTHTAEPPFLSVNLCERQLLQADGAAHVERILERSRCSAGRLRLELTETMIMENAGQVIQRMSELAGLGVGLCLDDFGTGYSSLSYLHQLPMQTIKIDRSFVSPGAGRLEILRAILGLAHTLGMSAEAEGIETGAQLARLRELGCEHGQGFVFSQAVPGLKARQLLGNRFPQ